MSISINNILKSFGETKALNNISFDVKENELFGLIGSDGAGKTTLFRILTTLLIADKGNASVANYDVIKNYKDIRSLVGYMPGRFSLYQDLTVEENLTFFATIFGTTIEENYSLIEDVYIQIEPFKKRRAGALSGGMKQKLALCCALIHKPKVLFLDEPTTGVDAVSRQEFWQMLKKLQKKNITILVSTPYMDEAELCDRIALIDKGEILDIDTPKRITEKFNKKIYDIQAKNTYKLLIDLKDYNSAYSVFPFGEFIHYIDKNSDFDPNDLCKYLEEKGNENIEINAAKTSIEDVFMDLMK